MVGIKKPKKHLSRYSATGSTLSPPSIAEKLETAYASLRTRFDGVNSALKETHNTLMNKILELDCLTRYLNSLLSHISQGILFINTAGVITTYNRAAEEILKKPSSEVLFKKFESVFSDGFFGFSMQEALQESSSPGTFFTQIEVSKGEPVDLEVTTNFIQDNGEEVEGLIVLVKDVTEYRQLEVSAQRKNRMNELGEMASMVAHEIRNPLGGIKGFAALLERDLIDRPDLQKMATYIIQGTDSLNELVTRVLNYSRPLQPHLKQTDLVVLAKDIKQHLETDQSLTGKAELTIQPEKESIKAVVDATAIRSALLNLILNSIQAMPDGGTVTLTIGQNKTHASLAVSDTGIGIPQENLKKIFSPFFTTRPEGNGFGLAEVFKVVQVHEGTIDVDSIVNKGTTFTIKLPLKRKI